MYKRYPTTNGWNLQLTGPRNERWLHNVQSDGTQQFVARFKYASKHGRFVKFLTKHFTPEQYFALLGSKKADGYTMSPAEVLETKGYERLDPKVRAQVAAYEARREAERREAIRVECEKPVPYGC